MVAPTFCVRRDDSVAFACCGVYFEGCEMHLVTETELQRYSLKPSHAQRYEPINIHTNLSHLLLPDHSQGNL